MNRPWMKWYPRDWRADPRLRMCSLEARGLWIELIGYMHEAEPYGHMLIDGKPTTPSDIAALVGRPLKEVVRAMGELEERGVYSWTETGAIYSRRMVRDNDRAEEGREHIGKRWPNRPPNRSDDRGPNRGATDPPITQMPDTRKKDAADAAPDPEKELFARGKQVLGERAGGMIKNLLKAKNGDLALARAAVETASTKQNPREYIGGIVNAKPREGEFVWKSGIPGVL